MAPRGSASTTFSQLTIRLQLAAFLLYGVAVSQEQNDNIPLAENAPPSVQMTKSIPLQKQYVPVMNKDNKVIAYKTSYFGELQVGTPAQTFSVVFDTGSGHIVIPKSTCNSEACKTHRRYSLGESTSSSDIKYDGSPIDRLSLNRDQAKISFGTGQVTGDFAQDKVCIGSAQPKCVNMRIMTALEMSTDPFGQFAFDGVMGLGLDAIRLNPQFSFFGEMALQHSEMLPQFSFFLSRHEDGQSAITFGGHDKSRASSEIQWAPVALPEHGHWLLQIKEVRIGGTILPECADGSCRAIADTGTSLLGVPRDALRSMHRFLARPAPTGEGVDTNQIDCRQVAGHTIEFDLGDDSVITLPAEVYSRPAPINITNENNTAGTLFCRSLLLPVDMAAPVGPKVFIWGEPVLRRYLTVYDFEKKRIGFSVARQTDAPVSEDNAIGAPPQGSLLDGAPLAVAVKPLVSKDNSIGAPPEGWLLDGAPPAGAVKPAASASTPETAAV